MFSFLYLHNKTPKVYCLTFGVHIISGSERITDGKVENETVTEFVDVVKARLVRSIGRVESDAEVEA